MGNPPTVWKDYPKEQITVGHLKGYKGRRYTMKPKGLLFGMTACLWGEATP